MPQSVTPRGVPPYLAPLAWYAGAEAALRPNTCVLPDGIVLRVPVEGGRKVLERLGPGQVMVSGHGRWQAEHLGAVNALWSRTAYYDHLRPRLEEAYAGAVGRPLAELCLRLHTIQMELLGVPGTQAAFEALRQSDPALAAGLRSDTLRRCPCTDGPLLGLLMHLGPDAIFLL